MDLRCSPGMDLRFERRAVKIELTCSGSFLNQLTSKTWNKQVSLKVPRQSQSLIAWLSESTHLFGYLKLKLSHLRSFLLYLDSPRPSPTPQPMQSGSGLKQPTTPPRPLTARTWAATVPTILSHKALIKLCTPVPVPCSVRHGPPVMVSPLERFLCCMHLKRHLTRCIQDELSTKVSN